MAQANYFDDTQAAIQRRLAATRAAAQSTVSRSAGFPSNSGIGVTELGAAPTAITPADLQNRAAQMRAQAPGAGIGSDVPAYARRTPGIATGTVDFDNLHPNERAGFARQGYVAPVAPPPAAATGPQPVSTPTAGGTVADATPRAVQNQPSRLSRFVGSAGRLATRGLGALGIAADARDAYADARSGDYAGATKNTALGIADSLATFAPNPITAAAALTAHAADYGLREGGPLDFIPKAIAQTDIARELGGMQREDYTGSRNMIEANRTGIPMGKRPGLKDEAYWQKDLADFNADRAARGLPVPVQRLPNITVNPPANFGVESGVATTAGIAGPSPEIQAQPRPLSDRGDVVPLGRTVNGVRTFSDNDNVPGVPRTMDANDMNALAVRAAGLTTADAGIGGNIGTEAAGRTLELGEGAPNGSNRGFSAADRQAQYGSIQQRGREAEFGRLMKKSEMALSRGSRKTAKLLADLATQARGEQPTPESPSAATLANARAQASLAEASNVTGEARGRQQQASILDQLNTERDPAKRQDLLDGLLASQGKDSGRIVTLKVRDPSGATDIAGNPVFNELPFDTRSKQFLYNPNGQSIAQ